jgi:hypothetical protein
VEPDRSDYADSSAMDVDAAADGYGQPLFDDMLARFVLPEVERRRADGSFGDDLVYRFQVLFPEGAQPEVRLNGDVGGTADVTAARVLARGEDVRVEDISGVSSYTPRREDAGVSHVTAFMHRDGWSLAFEFGRGGHSNRFEFLRLGVDYLETARRALAEGRLGPFVDNALSACELLAKAELLSTRPTVDLVLNSRSHDAIARPYHAWAKLGNTDVRFAKLLGRLAERRSAARYLDRDLDVDESDAEQIAGLLGEMREHAEARVNGGGGRAEPDVIYAYATRELRAGELVLGGDLSVMPPR